MDKVSKQDRHGAQSGTCRLTWPDSDIAHIVLTRAAVRNALNKETLDALVAMLATLAHADNPARCVILSGEGTAFCSGADLTDAQGLGFVSGKGLGEILDAHFLPLFAQLKSSDIPVVCAVNGPAVGIGVMLALMGDVIVASEASSFRLHFSRIGLVPDGGLTYWLPRILGRQKAMQMILLDSELSAQEALENGLVARVSPADKVQEHALGVARTIAAGPPLANRLARRLVWDAFDHDADQHWQAESAAQTICGKSADFKEGVMAFLQKRTPSFRGK